MDKSKEVPVSPRKPHASDTRPAHRGEHFSRNGIKILRITRVNDALWWVLLTETKMCTFRAH